VSEENPYEYSEGLEEYEEYCRKCCEDCPPNEQCPGCDCDTYCEEEELEYAWDEEEGYTWPDVCGVDPELDPLCYVEDEDEL
jgi:hypothetical protein